MSYCNTEDSISKLTAVQDALKQLLECDTSVSSHMDLKDRLKLSHQIDTSWYAVSKLDNKFELFYRFIKSIAKSSNHSLFWYKYDSTARFCNSKYKIILNSQLTRTIINKFNEVIIKN